MKKSNKMYILLFILLSLTACTTTNYETTIYKGGSAQTAVEFTIDKDIYSSIIELDLDLPSSDRELPEEVALVNILFQETAYGFNKAGYTVVPIEEERTRKEAEGTEEEYLKYIAMGFKAHKNYDSMEDLNDEVNKLEGLDLLSYNGNLEISKGFISDKYFYDGNLKLNNNVESIQDYVNVDDIFEYKKYMSESSTVMKVVLPGKITKTTSESEDGNEWVATMDNPNVEIKVLSSSMNTKNVVLSGAGLSVVVLGAFVLLKKKRKPE